MGGKTMNVRTAQLIRRGAAAAVIALVLLGTGCLEQRVVWSPDGSRAAVIGDNGLYLADADGRISGTLVADVHLAIWLTDSRQLLLARERKVSKWDEVAPLLGDYRAVVETKARDIAEHSSGDTWSKQVEASKISGSLLKLCLRDRFPEAMHARLSADDASKLESENVEIDEIVRAHTEGTGVVVDGVRYSGYGKIQDLRLSPDGDAVVFAEDSVAEKEGGRLQVFKLRDNDAPRDIGHNPNAFPDWSPDGRSVLYVEGASKDAPNELVLGAVARLQVFDEHGDFAIAGKPDYLAGMMFNAMTHVRCLRDGRIIFNAVEMTLPMAAADYGGDQREQLFALDLSRQATLTRLIPRKHETDLPQMLSFFEVSPDQKELLIGGQGGEVVVLELASGDINKVQDGDRLHFKGLPAWRRAGEFTYVKRMEGSGDKKPRRQAEIVLHRGGEKDIVWSESWSNEALEDIAKNDSR
jgi:hypothetical protein